MPTLQVKAILPKRNPFGTRFAVEQAMREALIALSQDMHDDFDSTAATWTHKPTFTVETTDTGMKITTSDANWLRVEGGTRPHVIQARDGGVLAFKTGYKPKTRVGVIGSSAGGASGDDAFSRVVRHPGTQARGFAKAINNKYKGRYQKYFARMLKTAAGQT